MKNQNFKKYIFYVSILSGEFFLSNFSLPVNAQIITQTVTPTPEQLRELEKQPTYSPNFGPLPETPLPPLEELLPKPDTTPTTPQPSLEEIPGTITITKFEVIGSTVFSQEELAKKLEPFTNTPISFAELLKAKEVINELYLENGYITSGAFIPPQELKDGVVKIAVIEGKVESINISGLNRLRPGYVRSRLALATKAPLDQNRLLQALQMLQIDPLIANLSAELAAGSRAGVSVLEIKVREADAFSTEISIDNQRSPSVGSVRRQLQINHNNFLGFGDRFQVGYINTDGSNSLNDLSYTFPINPYNGTIGLSYSRTHTNIIEDPFNILDIQSASRNYQITYRQPLYQSPTKEFILGLTGSRQESETTLLDEPFPLSPGANDQGEVRISALRFFQEYTQRDSQQVFALRSQFSLGINAFNATNNDDAPDSQFLTWRGQTQYLRLLTPDTTLLLRSDMQLSDRPLVALEQFSAGGQQSVRGYRQDSLLADNGLFASAEIRTAILRVPKWQTTLELTPFFDLGTVWNHSNSDVDIKQKTLSSLGVGLRLLVGQNFNARFDWGVPLVKVDRTGNSLQENGLYFSIEYKPF
ncbi:ShlB/FhaC/HecB family hemolysin secretion/activation protein [Anabaena sp. UHCC 0451]|uniref:ShlB/FhaC/HecB family hemolysin secretion/activation protein n=1 Tax=Anabaena sp. UHCC 0451 TaxID=2055235 RepID=UPI002B212233|nr:ShlB/FhaC/HecB family hemolysin secretion/activation protein [Anabaena sp. UHCC 0451]MEA5578608.1 ShlB/FhaC/HecB family hemolysin secretion/activation protein [Anabaena sp. UHCC 0451]